MGVVGEEPMGGGGRVVGSVCHLPEAFRRMSSATEMGSAQEEDAGGGEDCEQ